MVSPYRPYVNSFQGPTNPNTGNPTGAQDFGGGWGMSAPNYYGWSQIQSPVNQGHTPVPGSETYAKPATPRPTYYQSAPPAVTNKAGAKPAAQAQKPASGIYAQGTGPNPNLDYGTVINPGPQGHYAPAGGNQVAALQTALAPTQQQSQGSGSLPGYGLWGLGSDNSGYLGQQGIQAPQSDIERQMYPYGLAGSGGGVDAPDFGINSPETLASIMSESQIAAMQAQPAAPRQYNKPAWMNAPSSPSPAPGGGVSSPAAPGSGAGMPAPSMPAQGQNFPGLMNVNPVTQVTPPIYSDQMITANRNQQLANMARVTPESAAKQFETPGMSRSAGTWSAALPQLASYQAGALGNIAGQEFGMRNANAQNTLDQQYRREMEALGLANNEFGLQNAYGDLQDQARQRQINLLLSMLQGAGRLNTLGSYSGGY